MSLVVFNANRKGNGRQAAIQQSHEIDDFDLISQIREQNKKLILPKSTRNKLLKELYEQNSEKDQFYQNESVRAIEVQRIQKELEELIKSFKVIKIFGHFAGGMTVFTSLLISLKSIF